MRGYILSLQRQTQADQEARAAQIAATMPRATTEKPLAQQIVEVMRSLPPAVRDRPWSIQDVVNRLEGKTKARPHAQAVGQALRRLGWSRVRPFDASGQGRRMWLPPVS